MNSANWGAAVETLLPGVELEVVAVDGGGITTLSPESGIWFHL